jgi:Na+/proline symporter
VGKAFTVVWGIAQMGVAVLAQGVDSALQEGLAALGYASGPTVGAFLLGVLTRTANSTGTVIGMVTGLVVSLCVGRLARPLFGFEGVAWTWNVAVGAVTTFVVGMVASRLSRRAG